MDPMQIDILSLPTCALNLAYEEWYFTRFERESLRLWVNPKSVVVGKHQNALAECHFHFCRTENIPVVRRISGGGTVYHDPGNVNFSFFRWVQKDRMIDYDRSLNLILRALQSMGYPVEMNERHDLFLEGNKISGNAQHLKKGRSLHHGTILYDADLDALRSAIKRPTGKFEDKSVRSVRSPIANLREYKDIGSTEEFIQLLNEALSALGMVPKSFPQDERVLHRLIDEKYSKDDWNYGYSPHYTFTNQAAGLEIEMEVNRGGAIAEVKVYRDKRAMTEVETALSGALHTYQELSKRIDELHLDAQTKSSLMYVLF
ncbi:MAG: lipoate--protein ligase family protein [Cryomorphaceae bacterium]